MKSFVVATLLFGYVMLVPFCFFGGMFAASAHMMDMAGGTTHQMNDCGMLLGGCASEAGAGGMDAVAHHVGMYNAISQTPLMIFSVMLVALTALFLIAFGLVYDRLRFLPAQISSRTYVRWVGRQHNGVKQRILTWLSLFETSPNFA